MKYLIPIEFSNLFRTEKKEQPGFYLKTLDKSFLKLVSMQFIAEQDMTAKAFFQKYCNQESIAQLGNLNENKKELLDYLNSEELYVINTINSLKFYETINSIDYIERNTSLSDSEKELLILRAYLTLNDSSNKKSEEIYNNIPREIDNRCSWLILMQTLRYHSILHISNLEVFYTQLKKAFLFLKFLQSKYKNLLELFLKEMHCSSINEYINRFISLVLPSMQMSINNKRLEITIPDDHKFKEDRLFFEKLGHTDIEEDIDFRELRSEPLLRLDKNTYLPILPIFLIEQIYKGIYFRVSQINKKHKIIKSDLKSLIGSEFTEGVLLKKVIESIFDKKYKKISGNLMTQYAKENQAIVDYYIRNGNKIFLFELKDYLLSSKIITSTDFPTIYEELRKKFYSNEKKSLKGVTQLAESCIDILSENIGWDTNYKSKRVSIYPILIVTDNVFTVPGLNKIMNGWFFEYLKEKVPEKLTQINPLIVISIDTLLCYNDYFNRNLRNLDKIFKNYTNRFDPPNYFKNKKVNLKNPNEILEEVEKSIDFYIKKQEKVDWQKVINTFLKQEKIINI